MDRPNLTLLDQLRIRLGWWESTATYYECLAAQARDADLTDLAVFCRNKALYWRTQIEALN